MLVHPQSIIIYFSFLNLHSGNKLPLILYMILNYVAVYSQWAKNRAKVRNFQFKMSSIQTKIHAPRAERADFSTSGSMNCRIYGSVKCFWVLRYLTWSSTPKHNPSHWWSRLYVFFSFPKYLSRATVRAFRFWVFQQFFLLPVSAKA